jgi:hypothetical protein
MPDILPWRSPDFRESLPGAQRAVEGDESVIH